MIQEAHIRRKFDLTRTVDNNRPSVAGVVLQTSLVWIINPANSTTDIYTHPLCYSDHVVNLIFRCIGSQWSFIAEQNPAIWDAPLYIAVTFETIIQLKNTFRF